MENEQATEQPKTLDQFILAQPPGSSFKVDRPCPGVTLLRCCGTKQSFQVREGDE